MQKVVEITKENEREYLDQIAELEQIVLQSMKKEGREGQLFATGREDISEYVHSEENTVMVALNEKKASRISGIYNTGTKAIYI